MKRLGIIFALAFVLIVGGVYATFSYAQQDVAPANATLNKEIANSTTEAKKERLPSTQVRLRLKLTTKAN